MERPVHPPSAAARRAVHPGRVAAGAILITLGALTFVNQTDLFDRDAMKLFPGLVVTTFGLVRLAGAGRGHADTRGWRHTIDGLWLVAVGGWLMANAINAFGMRYETSWPLLLIAGGAFIVARGWGR